MARVCLGVASTEPEPSKTQEGGYSSLKFPAGMDLAKHQKYCGLPLGLSRLDPTRLMPSEHPITISKLYIQCLSAPRQSARFQDPCDGYIEGRIQIL